MGALPKKMRCENFQKMHKVKCNLGQLPSERHLAVPPWGNAGCYHLRDDDNKKPTKTSLMVATLNLTQL